MLCFKIDFNLRERTPSNLGMNSDGERTTTSSLLETMSFSYLSQGYCCVRSRIRTSRVRGPRTASWATTSSTTEFRTLWHQLPWSPRLVAKWRRIFHNHYGNSHIYFDLISFSWNAHSVPVNVYWNSLCFCTYVTTWFQTKYLFVENLGLYLFL